MQLDVNSLGRLLHDWGEPIRSEPVSGGCISQAYRVSVRSSEGKLRDVFVKRNAASFFENFACEHQGLKLLSGVEAIRVPQPLKVEQTKQHAWLVTEWIAAPTRTRSQTSTSFYELFGSQLAALHRRSRCHTIGLEQDNYLGAARQLNTPTADWIDFFGQQRLDYQLRWARQQGLVAPPLQRVIERIIANLPELLSGREPINALLHGDLWSGNYLADEQNQPVLIDPAVHYGCREAEFGMLQLFGNCPAAFYAAYQDAYPLPAGWQRRAEVYQLYHLLNHLNLFGRGYLAACLDLAGKLLRA